MARYRIPLPTKMPVVHYLKAHNVRSKPKDFTGDWLEHGKVYAADIVPHVITNKLHVRIHGHVVFPPYDTFAAWRFRGVATVWLN